MKTFIYGLCDPRTSELRYVGKSNNPTKRFETHVSIRRNGKSHKGSWVLGLLAQDLRPVVEIIEEVNDADWAEAERFWIAYFRFIGCDLTNGTDGGDGLHNPNNRTRLNMSQAHLGKRATPEQRAKQSAALKGRAKTETHRIAAAQAKIGYRFSSEARAKMSVSAKERGATHFKTYTVIFPNGEREEIQNLRQFCRENNLQPGHMCSVASGSRAHHKGFRCILIQGV